MPTYPPWAAGQRVTAGQLTAMESLYAYKASSTSRASTTTLTLDPDLQLTLSASGVYVVEMHIFYASGSTGKFTTSWQVPPGVSGNRGTQGLDSSVSNSTPEGVMRSGVHGFATTVTYGDRAGTSQLYCEETAIVAGAGTAGTVGLMWAQSASNATAVVVGAGSWMRADRIA